MIVDMSLFSQEDKEIRMHTPLVKCLVNEIDHEECPEEISDDDDWEYIILSKTSAKSYVMHKIFYSTIDNAPCVLSIDETELSA